MSASFVPSVVASRCGLQTVGVGEVGAGDDGQVDEVVGVRSGAALRRSDAERVGERLRRRS